MSQDERLKIFVSSTVKELKDARAIAREAINDFQFSPLMCEDWGAATESSRKTYLKEIQNSDVYIGIFWKNYSEPTVEEYREAIRLGKEICNYSAHLLFRLTHLVSSVPKLKYPLIHYL